MAPGQSRAFYGAEERKLIAFATPLIRAAVKGVNEAAHLAVARKFGAIREDVQAADPGMFSYVWGWFLQLSRKRLMEGMSGLHQPLQPSELKAWFDLHWTQPAAHELRLLDELDDIFIREERKARAAKSKQDGSKPIRKATGR
jgi:hypothetical protein